MSSQRTNGKPASFDDLTIFSVAYGNYRRFIPLFCVLAGKSFPGVRVVVSVPQSSLAGIIDQMRPTVLKLESEFRSSVVFRAMSLNADEFENEGFAVAGGALKLERWLCPREVFGGRRFGLTTDVDMAFLPSKSESLRRELDSITRRNVPFHNFLRSDNMRLSGGSHVILTRSYFDCVENEIELLRSSASHRREVFGRITALRASAGYPSSSLMRDENVLWYICRVAITEADFLEGATGQTSVPFGLHFGGGKGTVQGILSDTINKDLYRKSLTELAAEFRGSHLVATAGNSVPKQWLAAWFTAYKLQPPREVLSRPAFLFFSFLVYLRSIRRHLRELGI